MLSKLVISEQVYNNVRCQHDGELEVKVNSYSQDSAIVFIMHFLSCQEASQQQRSGGGSISSLRRASFNTCGGRGRREKTVAAAAAASGRASKSISVSRPWLNGQVTWQGRRRTRIELSGDNTIRCQHLALPACQRWRTTHVTSSAYVDLFFSTNQWWHRKLRNVEPGNNTETQMGYK